MIINRKEYQTMKTLQDHIDKLNKLNFKEMYENDFFLTWEKTDDELEAVFTLADALRFMRQNNISTKVFESGLGRKKEIDFRTGDYQGIGILYEFG